jgi:hypothetical protein
MHHHQNPLEVDFALTNSGGKTKQNEKQENKEENN